jgi:hypothetical protein
LLLEYGLFVAKFGRRRALLLAESGKRLKLPTDVGGLTYIPFRRTKKPKAGLSEAITAIKLLADVWYSASPLDSLQTSRVEAIVDLLLSEIRTRSGIESDFGLHVFIVDRRYAPPQLVRVVRKRLSAKPPKPRFFGFGEGVVGVCWRDSDAVFVDFSAEPLASLDEDDYVAGGYEPRLGMKWDFFERSRARYKAVGAVPISSFRPGSDVEGCIAYNLGWESEADTSSLRQPAVIQMLGLCSEGVAAILGQR